jgi:hypothetical protein
MMMRRLGNAFCLLTLTLLLGVAAGRPAAAIEIIVQEPASSLREELDAFAAATRARAAYALERTGQKFAAFKALMRTQAEGFAAALRNGKTQFATLDWNARLILRTGKSVAAEVLVMIRRSAADTLERIAAWMRPPAQAPLRSETHA